MKWVMEARRLEEPSELTGGKSLCSIVVRQIEVVHQKKPLFFSFRCQMECGGSANLWPRPTGPVSLSGNFVNFLPRDVSFVVDQRTPPGARVRNTVVGFLGCAKPISWMDLRSRILG